MSLNSWFVSFGIIFWAEQKLAIAKPSSTLVNEILLCLTLETISCAGDRETERVGGGGGGSNFMKFIARITLSLSNSAPLAAVFFRVPAIPPFATTFYTHSWALI